MKLKKCAFIILCFSFLIFGGSGSEDLKVISFLPDYIQAGDVLIMKLEGKIEAEKIRAEFDGRNLPVTRIGENLIVIIGLDIRKPAGKYDFVIFVKNLKGNFEEFYKSKITINQFRRRTINSEEENSISTKFLEQYQKEREFLALVLNKTEEKPLFKEKFVFPLKKIKITGQFGSKRIYKNGQSTFHRGVDFRAPTGTKVYAVNSGKVILARDFTLEGKFVAIDHGAGIISFYIHLKKFIVKEGDLVSRKQLIGFSDNSGNSRSPHLHFSIMVNAKEAVDPVELIEFINKFS